MRLKNAIILTSLMLALSQVPGKTASVEKVKYLAIVSPSCETAIASLVRHRQNQGESVKVIKVTDITNSNSTKTVPDTKKIWDYLNTNHKEMGLSHVLFVGDVIDIPMPKLYPKDNNDQPTTESFGPLYSDAYYSVLGIDWDRDKDGRLGEPRDDGIVFNPTISVGRLPFSEPVIIEKICQSIIGYDTSPYRRSIIQAGAIYSYDKENNDYTNTFTDGSDMMESIWSNVLLRAKFLRKTLYEKDGLRPKDHPLPKYDRPLDNANLLDLVTNQEFGMLNILAHGETDRVNRKTWLRDENGNGIPEKGEIKTPELLSAEQLMGKTVRSSIVVSTACSTGSIAGGAASLGTAFMRQGSSAFIGATAINYFIPSWKSPSDGGNQTITYDLTRHYCDGESLGWSLSYTMRDFFQDFSKKPLWTDKWAQNVYSYILLGDPAMRLDPILPKTNMTMNFNPPSVAIAAGEKGQTYLNFGIQSSQNELSLAYEGNPLFTVTFNPPKAFPSQTVTITVSVPRSMNPGVYEISILCDSSSHKGRASFGIRVTPPESGPTEVIIEPEYVYATPKQEFWVDILIKPTQPVRSMSGLLQYDSSVLELVDKRLGDFATFDYLCPDWQVVDNPTRNQLSFSFFRNSTVGAISTDIAFSLCFKGKKESISDITGASFDIRTPANKSHIVAGIPSSRVKVHPQGLTLTISSKPSPGNDRIVTLSGTATPNQQFTINNELVTINSDGKYSKSVTLTKFRNDFIMKLNNIVFDPVKGSIDLDRVLLVRKLVMWPTRRELAFRIKSKTVWNNSVCGKLDQEPFIDNASQSTMVPWRYISEQLGFAVGYDPKTRTITAKKGTILISMTVGLKTALVNGKNMGMSAAPAVVNGTTFVPLRFVGDSIGAKVGWLPTSKTATVFYPQ